jgi:hypothetical protein
MNDKYLIAFIYKKKTQKNRTKTVFYHNIELLIFCYYSVYIRHISQINEGAVVVVIVW